MAISQHPWTAHGPLRVGVNRHFIEHEDGKRFFWLGDTAWRLTTLKPVDVRRYFSIRARQGFNVVHFNATSWAFPNWDGFLPFVGNGPTWEGFSPEEEYWRHIDSIFDIAESHGIYLQLSPWWGHHADSKLGSRYFASPEEDNFRFGKFLGERYGFRSNLLWCVSGEYQRPYTERRPIPMPVEHLKHFDSIAEGMRAGESFRHLMTIHPNGLYSSSEDFHDHEWLDFNTVQTHKGFDYIDHLITDDWEREPVKPVLNSEGWYEAEPSMYELPTWEKMDVNWLQRLQAYWSVFFGSFGYTYGHSQVWKMRELTNTQGTFPGQALGSDAPSQLIHLRNLVEHYASADWSPDRRLLTGSSTGSDFGRFYGTSPNLNCAIRANDSSWAMVYSTRGMNICIRTDHLNNGKGRFAWFSPEKGKWWNDSDCSEQPLWEPESFPCGEATSNQWFYPPHGERDGNDWVLFISVVD